MIKNYDQLIKLILIGGSGVGKSSLMMRYANGTFDEEYRTTIGVDFKFHTVKTQGKNIKFQIWDTAGQERFKNITSNYYKGADGIIMVYDLTDPNSVKELERYWIPQVYQHCSKDIKVLVLGNKNDADNQVNTAKVQIIVQNYGFTTQKVSAMTGEKVNDSITKFGVGIAIAKMEKANKSKISQSINIFKTFNVMNSQPSIQKPQKYHQREPKDQQYSPIKAVQKNPNKHVIINKTLGTPSYQKKCC